MEQFRAPHGPAYTPGRRVLFPYDREQHGSGEEDKYQITRAHSVEIISRQAMIWQAQAGSFLLRLSSKKK